MGHGLRRSYEEDAPINIGVRETARRRGAFKITRLRPRRAALGAPLRGGDDGRGDGVARRGDGAVVGSSLTPVLLLI